MNGYLQRLVERHAAEPAIRPRAASRFEAGASDVGGIEVEQAIPTSVTGDGAAAMRRVPGSVPTSAARRDGSPERDAEFTEQHDTGPVFSEPRAAPPSSRPASETPHAALSEDDPVPAPRNRRDVVRSEAIVFAEEAAAPDGCDEAPPPHAPRPTPAVGPIVPRRLAATARWDRVAAPITAPRRDVETPTREPDVVRVHIGRIEVRAVQAPSDRGRTAPAPRDDAGPVSLDRYLAGSRRP